MVFIDPMNSARNPQKKNISIGKRTKHASHTEARNVK